MLILNLFTVYMNITLKRTEVPSGETTEELGPETNHSAQSLLVSVMSTASTPMVIPSANSEQSLQEPSAATSRQSTHSHQAAPEGHGGIPAAYSRIKWPQSSKKAVWHQFDEDVDQVLEGTAKGDVERRLKTMTSIIVSIAAERFGSKEVKPRPSAYTPNHRARKIQRLREELTSLKRQYRKAGDE